MLLNKAKKTRFGPRLVGQADLTKLDRELISLAEEASRSAYAPYSNFHVGAAIRSADGGLTTGCNVENVSYGVTMCAEVGAVMAAVRQRRLPMDAIAIYGRLGGPDAPGPRTGKPLAPCGRCRQVLAEMALAGQSHELRIICSDPARDHALVGTISDFLPGALDDGLVETLIESKVALVG